jgi:hypothetical protein
MLATAHVFVVLLDEPNMKEKLILLHSKSEKVGSPLGSVPSPVVVALPLHEHSPWSYSAEGFTAWHTFHMCLQEHVAARVRMHALYTASTTVRQ